MPTIGLSCDVYMMRSNVCSIWSLTRVKATARKSKQAHIKSVLKDFDASRSGGLKIEELRAWLAALENNVRTPTDLEVIYAGTKNTAFKHR